MQIRASTLFQKNRRLKYQEATVSNHKNVHLLDMKLYDALVLLVSKMDPNSISKLARTCTSMHEKVTLMRGVTVPFDMGILKFTVKLDWNFTEIGVERHFLKYEAFKWNWTIAGKVQPSIPLLQPFIRKIDVESVTVNGKLIKKMNKCLNKIKATKVTELCADSVENSSWEKLKSFINRYGIEKVSFRGDFPEEHQLSPLFLHMDGLQYTGEWSEEYLKTTTRKKFDFSFVTYEGLTTVMKRWNSEDFSEWCGKTRDMKAVKKHMKQYPTVTFRQRRRFPNKRPLLCVIKERYGQTLAILRQDGKVVFVEYLTLRGLRFTVLSIHFAEEHEFPASFKKILGV